MIDQIIQVERAVSPFYPAYLTKPIHPELECAGPDRYDLSEVGKWLHTYQKIGEGLTIGHEIHLAIKEANLLPSCLNFQDAYAIKRKGLEVYREYFGGSAVFFWKTVRLDRWGALRVPYLYEVEGELTLNWFTLDYYWTPSCPALLFQNGYH